MTGPPAIEVALPCSQTAQPHLEDPSTYYPRWHTRAPAWGSAGTVAKHKWRKLSYVM